MPVLNVHKRNLKIIYKTTLCTNTTVFVLLLSCASVIFPLIFAYRSRGFWLKHDTFYEQPDVKFKGQYLLVGLTNNASNVIICNNFHNFKQFNMYDLCSTVKVREIDMNFDGKIDLLDFHLEVDLPEKENLVHINLLLTLDYKLRTVCPLEMQSGIIIQQNVPLHSKGLDIKANLKIVQKSPLLCFYKGSDKIHNYPLIRNELDPHSYRIDTILSEYLQRNLTTHLEEIYTTFRSSSPKFTINMKVAYPEHRIYYRPAFWQIMKWAWIQYFAVYVLFAYFFHKIKNYIFDHNLLLFFKVMPFKTQ